MLGPIHKQLTALELRINTHLSHIRFNSVEMISVSGHPSSVQTEESGAQQLLRLGRRLANFRELAGSAPALGEALLGPLFSPAASGRKEASAQPSFDLYYSNQVFWLPIKVFQSQPLSSEHAVHSRSH